MARRHQAIRSKPATRFEWYAHAQVQRTSGLPAHTVSAKAGFALLSLAGVSHKYV